MLDNLVYIMSKQTASYPASDYQYSPSSRYPEYQFTDISPEANHVYDMVRKCLYGMQLDTEHYGLHTWNPLGEIIKQGDTVLIKPNMVSHINHREGSGLECIVTHPSIVRAIADYALIALNGTGKLMIGDAPVQQCDFENLVHTYGYGEILTFYEKHGLRVPLLDFRLVKSKHTKYGNKILENNRKASGYVTVNIGEDSAFFGLGEQRYRNLRVTNYDPNEMLKHHCNEVQEYLIPEVVLKADVVINLPKPKTHRKAGVTIALKNMVGIIGHKDWIPHHTRGALKGEGGDEYLNKSLIKHIKTLLIERIDVATIKNHRIRKILNKMVLLAVSLLGKPFQQESFSEGSWYGNDTIWRTICDLNRILLYADKYGIIQKQQQRKTFILADMVISGEGEGPLKASPKEAGIVVAGHQAIGFDQTIATIMGFDFEKIPSIYNAGFGEKVYLQTGIMNIKSNNPNWNEKNITNLRKEKGLQYLPTSGWKGHIELDV